MDEDTRYHPVDPTTPVPAPYDPYAYHELTQPVPDPEIGIPLPPPYIKHRRRWLPLSLWLTLLLVSAAVLFLTVRYIPVAPGTVVPPTVQSSVATATDIPTWTPTPNTEYSASDIVRDLQAIGCDPCTDGQSEESVPEFLGPGADVYPWPQPVSEMLWTDPVSLQFYNVGLWVYADTATAWRAERNVGAYDTASGPGVNNTVPAMQLIRGRCLFLISGDTMGATWQDYEGAISRYCI